MKKISIIVPIYNVEEYLVECMESIINQTLDEIEIICVNDGSTDNSLSIIQEYANIDNRIVVLDGPNGGYGRAMNRGIEKATGEYIGIVEPDDFVHLNMFKHLYQVAKDNDLDVVKSDFYRFTRNVENGNMNLIYNHLSSNADDYNRIIYPSEYKNTYTFIMNTWSGIYRRDFIKENNILHHETAGASFQDNGFWFLTMCLCKSFMILDKPFYMNRRDNPNSSVHNPNKVYCMNDEYNYIENELRKRKLWDLNKGIYYYARYKNCRGSLNRCGDEYKKEYCKKLYYEFKDIEENIDWNYFNKNERTSLKVLLSDWNAFYYMNCVRSFKEKQLQEEYDLIVNSLSYKMGRILTAVPRKIRDFVK